jgi:hypothetical protein
MSKRPADIVPPPQSLKVDTLNYDGAIALAKTISPMSSA